MKGYQLDNKLYVFPQTPDTIPFVDSDVTVIYVQEENLPAWKEKNSTVAEMIVKYNYNLISVQKKEWAGHTNDDIYVPVTPELAWSAETATAQIGETNTYPTLTNPHSVTVTYSSSDSEKATIDASTGEITLVAEGTTIISASFAGDDDYEAQTVTYTLTVLAAKVSPELAWSSNSATATIGDTNTYPTLTNPNSVTVSYTSSDTSAATIDQTTGTITLVAAGATTISAVFEGNTTYLAQTVTYTLTVQAAPSHDYEQDYFTIRSLDDNNDVSFTKATGTTGDLSYSLDDGSTWNTYTNAITLNNNDTVLFKGEFVLGDYGTGKFASTGDFAVEGNIMSLLKGDNFVGETDLTGYDYPFYQLFYNKTGLTSAENLVLPATTLTDYCYNEMFRGCTSLTTAPELPATILTDSCYESMLRGCTSLTSAPVLPATTLANSCYKSMFRDCIALNYIKCLATDISATDCTSNWVSGVAATGTFVKDASMSSWTTGDSGIPSGWDVEDAPA